MSTEQGPTPPGLHPLTQVHVAFRHFINSSDGRALACSVLESKPIEVALETAFTAGWGARFDWDRKAQRADVLPTTISRTLLRLLAGAQVSQDEKIDALAWVGARC